MKLNFSAGEFSVNAAGPDGLPKRTVEGVAVEWNTVATVSSGQRVKFLPGSLPTDGPAPKFMLDHSPEKPLGMVFERTDNGSAMLFAARVGPGQARDEVLAMAGPGEYYDSVSVGVEPTDYTFGAVGTEDENVMIVKAGRWMELSLLPFGAFATAKVAQVAAAEPDETEEPQTTDSEEEPEVATQETPAAVEAAVPTSPVLAAKPAAPFTLPSMGEYVSKFLKGGSEFAEFNARIKAAAPDVTTTDTPGLLPDPIVGPVYTNLIAQFRPVINAFGVTAMPSGSGKQFQLPYVSTHTTIGASNGENVALDAGQYVVDSLTVTKQVEGGYVRLSEEDMDWTSPEVLQGLIEDMARKFAYRSDDVAADALVAGTTNTNNFTSANIADPTEWITWIYTAAADILSGSNGHLPDTIFLAGNRWASLGQLEDGSGRPLFPQFGPMNAYGSLAPNSDAGNAFGLRVVVDSNLASGTLLVGTTNDGAFRYFEQNKGVISVEAADGSLSRYIKFRGYVGTAMVDSTRFIKAAFV